MTTLPRYNNIEFRRTARSHRPGGSAKQQKRRRDLYTIRVRSAGRNRFAERPKEPRPLADRLYWKRAFRGAKANNSKRGKKVKK